MRRSMPFRCSDDKALANPGHLDVDMLNCNLVTCNPKVPIHLPVLLRRSNLADFHLHCLCLE